MESLINSILSWDGISINGELLSPESFKSSDRICPLEDFSFVSNKAHGFLLASAFDRELKDARIFGKKARSLVNSYSLSLIDGEVKEEVEFKAPLEDDLVPIFVQEPAIDEFLGCFIDGKLQSDFSFCLTNNGVVEYLFDAGMFSARVRSGKRSTSASFLMEGPIGEIVVPSVFEIRFASGSFVSIPWEPSCPMILEYQEIRPDGMVFVNAYLRVDRISPS